MSRQVPSPVEERARRFLESGLPQLITQTDNGFAEQWSRVGKRTVDLHYPALQSTLRVTIEEDNVRFRVSPVMEGS